MVTKINNKTNNNNGNDDKMILVRSKNIQKMYLI